MYGMMAGLKIKFNKTEVVMIDDDNNWGSLYADSFKCQVGKFLIEYLGYLLALASYIE
jgi:hypothetical protein